MKILMIGDSLVEGIVGVNYVDMLQKERPNDRFINRGIGGDTLKNIINRLLREVDKTHYDLVILTGGHNDIMLPEARKRGVKWEQFVKQIVKGGAVLTESEAEFHENLTLLDEAMRHQGIPLIVTTLTPLGERLESPLNIKRKRLNNGIRSLKNAIVCDVARAFEEVLEQCDASDYLMNSLSKLLEEDATRCESGEDLIMSEERGLSLTIDGAHLNSKGAMLYRDALMETIESLARERA